MILLPQASAISSGRTTFPKSAHFKSSCMTKTRCVGSAPSMEGRTQLSCAPSQSEIRAVRVASRFAELRGVASRDERATEPASLAASPSPSPASEPSRTSDSSLRVLSCIQLSSRCRARASARNACSCLKRPMCLAMSVARMSVVTSSRNRPLSASSRNSTIPQCSSSSSSNTKPRWNCSRTLSRYFLYSACLLFFRNALFRRK